MNNEACLPDRLQLGFLFSEGKLRSDLDRLSQVKAAWIDHFVKSNYDGSWSVIPLRANRGAVHPIQQIYSYPDSKDFVDTPFLDHCLYFKEVLATFKTTIYAARLMCLGTGSVIKEHQDYDLDFESGCIRLHIPILTNPKVCFLLNGERVIMKAGTCWYLRLSDPHSVRNDGPDRVHLVIDLEVNDWVTQHFNNSAKAL